MLVCILMLGFFRLLHHQRPFRISAGERSATHVHDKGDAHLQACRKEVRKALLLHRRAPFKTPLRCLYKVSCEFGRSECG